MQRATMLHPAAIPAASRVDDGCVSMGKRTPTSKERAVQEGVPRCRAGPAYQTPPPSSLRLAESGRVGGRGRLVTPQPLHGGHPSPSPYRKRGDVMNKRADVENRAGIQFEYVYNELDMPIGLNWLGHAFPACPLGCHDRQSPHKKRGNVTNKRVP